VGHLQRQGFPVKTENHLDLRPIKAKYRVRAELEACHTALVAGYVVEGHMPATVIIRLLREHPKIVGLAVPGVPAGSPGMEMPGRDADSYQTFTFDQRGKRGVFAAR
jgi:hypothetical protein